MILFVKHACDVVNNNSNNDNDKVPPSNYLGPSDVVADLRSASAKANGWGAVWAKPDHLAQYYLPQVIGQVVWQRANIYTRRSGGKLLRLLKPTAPLQVFVQTGLWAHIETRIFNSMCNYRINYIISYCFVITVVVVYFVYQKRLFWTVGGRDGVGQIFMFTYIHVVLVHTA